MKRPEADPVELIEIRPDSKADPGGRRLSDFLNAHFAWERAVARRRDLVSVLALLSVPVFACVVLHLPESLLGAALMLYAVTGALVLLAWMNERASREAVRETERDVDVRRVPPQR